MSRDILKFKIADLSGFATNLRKQLMDADEPPRHLTFMGMVAKAAGYRNLQHLQSQANKGLALDPAAENKLKRALRVFNEDGKMAQWPAPTAIQALCLWPIWFDLPRNKGITEKQLNTMIQNHIDFEDYPLVRRSLIDHKLMTRTLDGSVYTRVSQTPPDEAVVLNLQLKGR